MNKSGVPVVQRLDEGLGRIVRRTLLRGVPAGFFLDHLALVQFAVPNAFVHHLRGEFGTGRDLADRQRLGLLRDPQSVGGVVAGEDAPEAVGVRIVVQLARQPVDLTDKRPQASSGVATKQAYRGNRSASASFTSSTDSP